MAFLPPCPRSGLCRAAACSTGLVAALAFAGVAPNDAGAESLTLAGAVVRSLAENPELRVLEQEHRAAQARSDQAGARSNPEVSFDLENFGGDLSGFSSSETTLSLGQLFELGGKRRARFESANAASRAIALELEATRRAIAAETARRYYAALAAEKILALLDDAARLAEEVKTAVASKVRVGAVPRTEETRAELELESALVRREEAASEAALSRVRLASLWGDVEPRFDSLAGSFETVESSPRLETLRARLERSPQVARHVAEIEEKRALRTLAKSIRMPDVTVRAGVRRFSETDDLTFVANFSAPIPLFDRSRGRLEEADAMIARSEAALERAKIDVSLRLAESHALIERSRKRVESLRTKILPAAERAFQETRDGYALGRFEYIDLLEARRALAGSRREEIAALLEHHVAVADAELLLGEPLGATDETEQETP